MFLFVFTKAVEHDSTLENTPSLSLQSLTEEEKVFTSFQFLTFGSNVHAYCFASVPMNTSLIHENDISLSLQSESTSIRDEELQGLRQQHALLKKMLDQQQQVRTKIIW